MNRNALLAAIAFVAVIVAGVALTPAAMAQEAASTLPQQDLLAVMKQTENPGLLPDSPFYGLKIGFEKIRLILVRDRIKRAEMALELAQKRLREAKMLAAMGKPEAMEKAIKNYDAIMERLERELEKARAENDTERVAMIESLISRLEMQMSELEDAESIAEVSVQDNRTRQEVLQRLEQLRKRMEERREKMEARKEMIKEMLKKRYNLTDEQAEMLIEKAEKKVMEKNIKARAELELRKANRTIMFVEGLVTKMEMRNVSAERIENAKDLLESAKELYEEAVENYNEGDYFVAWELAKESQRMAHLAIARPSERALYRFLERKRERERYACGPGDAEMLASKLVPGANCKVTAEVKGIYAVRCRVGGKVERFAVRARDCEIRNVKDLVEMRKEIMKELRERRELGAALRPYKPERIEIATRLRERLRKIEEEKGSVTPEDVKQVLRELAEERMQQHEQQVGAGEKHNVEVTGETELNVTTTTEVAIESENEVENESEEAPPLPTPAV